MVPLNTNDFLCLTRINILVPAFLYLYYMSKIPFANRNTPSRGQLGTVSGEENIPRIIFQSEEKLYWILNSQWKLQYELHIALRDPLKKFFYILTEIGKKYCQSGNTAVEQKAGSW